MPRKEYDARAFQKDVGHHFTKAEVKKSMVDDYAGEIGILLKKPLGIEDRILIACRMTSIGAYYSTLGALNCFDSPDIGWKQIKQGMLYNFWEWRILERQWKRFHGKTRQGFRNAIHIANQAALALVIFPELGHWHMGLLEQSLKNKYLNWSGEDFYPAFLVRLYRRLKREPDITDIPPNPWNREQPYVNFFDSWNDDNKYHDTIIKLCDYHLRWNFMDTKNHRAEFSERFAAINPVEIHAIEYVRKALKLSTPHVEHRLLLPPFYPLPAVAYQISVEDILIEDPLLKAIIDSNQPWCDSPVEDAAE